MTTVYIVCGSPGAGKTTYGKQLAAEKGAVFLDIDGSTERLVRLALRQSGRDPDDRDSSHFKQTFRTPIYEQLFDIARDNLSISSVVIERGDLKGPPSMHTVETTSRSRGEIGGTFIVSGIGLAASSK
jgi:cytidylate kinase